MADLPTSVFICDQCDHAQSPDLPDLQHFYDSEYRISLGSEDHDQLYAVENGKAIYRTDKQAQVALDLLAPAQGARLLDYGAAKAATLRKIKAARPDLDVCVFDVSDSYRSAWQGWLDDDHAATHRVPGAWRATFDAVTAHFVVEHVAEPRDAIETMASLLKPNGRLLVSVPDPLANSGDLIVVDHINHFSAHSLHRLLSDAGLCVERIEKNAIKDALVVIAVKLEGGGMAAPARGDASHLAQQCSNWTRAQRYVSEKSASLQGSIAAIYGAGFYGAWLYSIIRERIAPVCFLDNNAHLQGTMHFGVPVLGPPALPSDIATLFVGLNPRHAREIIAGVDMPRKDALDLVFIPGD